MAPYVCPPYTPLLHTPLPIVLGVLSAPPLLPLYHSLQPEDTGATATAAAAAGKCRRGTATSATAVVPSIYTPLSDTCEPSPLLRPHIEAAASAVTRLHEDILAVLVPEDSDALLRVLDPPPAKPRQY